MLGRSIRGSHHLYQERKNIIRKAPQLRGHITVCTQPEATARPVQPSELPIVPVQRLQSTPVQQASSEINPRDETATASTSLPQNEVQELRESVNELRDLVREQKETIGSLRAMLNLQHRIYRYTVVRS